MAQKVIVELADDIDGTEATQTVIFAVRGVEYEIDLSDANAASLDKAIAPFVAHGRRISGRKRAAGRATVTSGGFGLKAVRAWAAEQGIDVGSHGRISDAIVKRYRNAL